MNTKTEEPIYVEIRGEEYLLEDTVESEHLGELIPRDMAQRVINEHNEDDWLWENDSLDFNWAEDEGCYIHYELGFYCDIENCTYYETDYQTTTYCGETVHEHNVSESSDWRYVERGIAEGYYVWYENVTYCEDIDQDVHEDDAHYCESSECSYWDEDNCGSNADADYINTYHTSKNFVERIIGGSVFTIGFEVEKKHFELENETAEEDGDFVGTYDLFAGYECDSSCGVEAVSHILPLCGPRHRFRNKVFDLMDEARDIINSPTDKSCGGHVTVAVKGEYDGYNIVDKMRQPLALIYALYRWRLKRTYCEQNKPAKRENNYKYSPVHVKSGGKVELRLPSAVRNVKQLKLRYDLIYKIMYHSFTRPVSFEVFLQKVRHIVKKMYNGNDRKVDIIYDIARDFRRYLIAEEITDRTDEYINPKNEEE